MCLQGAVGHRAANRFEDVKVVQLLLNCNLSRIPAIEPLVGDGVWGPQTEAAIRAFQESLGVSLPDGCVDPDSATFAALRAGAPRKLSRATLQGTMPYASDANIDKYLPALLSAMQAYEIRTPQRQAHFLAQIAQETGSLVYAEEIDPGIKHEQRADLGNTRPGDGIRFKGRGLLPIIGRANYAAYGAVTRRNFVDRDWDLLATDPHLAVDAACWFWKVHGLNQLADVDDSLSITKRITGGYTGLNQRLAYLARAKVFLGVTT